MSFRLLVAPSVNQEIAGRRLPGTVVREFYVRLVDELESSRALDFIRMTETGMEHVVSVESEPGTFYVFVSRLRRNDIEFHVTHCACFREENGEIRWSSTEDS